MPDPASPTRVRSAAALVLLALGCRAATAQDDPSPAAASPGSSPAGLALPADDATAWLAAALFECREGRFEIAAAWLDALPSLPDRLSRERARIGRLLAFRDAMLRAAMASDEPITLPLPQPIHGRVTAVGADAIEVRTGNETRTVPLAALTAEVLVRTALRCDGFDGDDAWFEGYLRALAGDRRHVVERVLRRAGESGATVLGELDETWMTALANGPPAALLCHASSDPRPERGPPARAALDRLESVLKSHGDHPWLQSRRPQLEAYARLLLDSAFEIDDPNDLLIAGKIEPLEGGQVRLVYDFSSPDQLHDFVPYELHFGADVVAPQIQATPPRAWIEDSTLRMQGDHRLRSIVPLRAPLSIALDVEMVGTEFHFGIYDPGEGGFLFTGRDAFLEFRPKAGGSHDYEYLHHDPFALYENQTYAYGLRHEGEEGNVESVFEGDPIMVAPSGDSPRSGFFSLDVFDQNPVLFRQLVLVGRLDPDHADALRERWVDAKLAELFPD